MAVREQQGLVRGTHLWHFEMAHLTSHTSRTSYLSFDGEQEYLQFKRQANPINEDKLLYKTILASRALKYAQ